MEHKFTSSKNFSDAIVDASKKVSHKVAISGFLLLIFTNFLIVWLNFHNHTESIQTVLKKGLVNPIVTGDSYQISRMLNVLIQTKTITNGWIVGPNDTIISSTTTSAPSHNIANLCQDKAHLNISKLSYETCVLVDDSLQNSPVRLILENRLPLFELILVFTLTAFVFLLFYILVISSVKSLAKTISGPILNYISAIQDLSNEKSIHRNMEKKLVFSEFIDAWNIFLKIWNKNRILNRLEMEIERSKATFEITQQLSHDIRSPVMALSAIEQKTVELPPNIRSILKQCISRIQDLATDFLSTPLRTDKTSNHILPTGLVIDKLVQEKQILYSHNPSISIQASTNGLLPNSLAKINHTDLTRIISNLIDNSVEAMSNHIRVTATIAAEDRLLHIEVEDNGKGIPQSLLQQLGRRHLSIGKEDKSDSGFGLGLYHAKKTIELWNGTLVIKSTVGKGTSVRINIPYVELSNTADPSLVKHPLPEL